MADDWKDIPADILEKLSFNGKTGKWSAIVAGVVVVEETFFGLVQAALRILGWL